MSDVSTHLNAVVRDPQIFVCTRTWITKYWVVCIQLAAGLVAAPIVHNRLGILRVAVGVGHIRAWTGGAVMSAVGCLQREDSFPTRTALSAPCEFTSDKCVNALVSDQQIFVCTRTRITKHWVVCKQLTAILEFACGRHNRMRICRVAIGVASVIRAWAEATILSAIGRLQDMDYFSRRAAYGMFFTLTNANWQK